MPYDVVSIGNAIVDMISKTDAAFVEAEGMGTMQLISADRAKSLYDRMGHAVEISGGSGANTMVGVASLGGKAAFIGKVGNDKLGEIYAHEIKVAGVDFFGGISSPNLPTAVSMILVTPDAQRYMNTYLGACTDLGPEDVDPKVIADADLLYIEGYQWNTPRSKEAIRKAAAIAKQAGKKRALSLSDVFVIDSHYDDLTALIRDEIDILFGNEAEVLRLTGKPDFDSAARELTSSKMMSVVTRGKEGAVVIDGGSVAAVPASPVSQVVDTTGAGDLFAAGFLYGYTHGRTLVNCALLGALAAAEIISHIGARPEANLREMMTKAGL